jgi:hypothetical protein
MPESNHSENSEQNPAPEQDAEYTNRAARRRRGKNRSTAAGADASARDTGRRYMGQGARQWTIRHGG